MEIFRRVRLELSSLKQRANCYNTEITGMNWFVTLAMKWDDLKKDELKIKYSGLKLKSNNLLTPKNLPLFFLHATVLYNIYISNS